MEDVNANADDDIGDKEDNNAGLTMNINDDVGNKEVAKLTDEQYYSMFSDYGNAV